MYSTVLQKEILENIFLYEHRCIKLEYNFKFDFSPHGMEVIFNFFLLTFFWNFSVSHSFANSSEDGK